MATPTPQQAEERIRNLPQSLRQVLFSGDTADKVFEIGAKHKLLIDKTGELAGEIGNFMIGATKPSEFIGNLVTRLNVDKDTARSIANDVNEQIFSPIRTELRALHGVESPKEKTPAPEPKIANISPSEQHGRDNKEGDLPEDTSSALFEDRLNFVEEEKTSTAHVKDSSIETLKYELNEAVEEPSHLKEKSSYPTVDPYRESVLDDAPPPLKPFPKSLETHIKKEPPPSKPISPPPALFSHLPNSPITNKNPEKQTTSPPNTKPTSPFKNFAETPPDLVIDPATIADERVSFTPIQKKNETPVTNSPTFPVTTPLPPASPIIPSEPNPNERIPSGGSIPTFRGFSAETKQVEGVPQVPEHLKPAASPPPPKPSSAPIKSMSVETANTPTKNSPSNDMYREPIS